MEDYCCCFRLPAQVTASPGLHVSIMLMMMDMQMMRLKGSRRRRRCRDGGGRVSKR